MSMGCTHPQAGAAESDRAPPISFCKSKAALVAGGFLLILAQRTLGARARPLAVPVDPSLSLDSLLHAPRRPISHIGGMAGGLPRARRRRPDRITNTNIRQSRRPIRARSK